MTPIEQLRTTLAALSLTAIDARLDALLETAAKKEPSYADFLAEVMNTEADARRQRYLKARLQLAHLPYLKTFQQFDFSFQPSIDERQISELRTLRFVHEASNGLEYLRGFNKLHQFEDEPWVAAAADLERCASWAVSSVLDSTGGR